jgi:dihydropteroate synthase
MNKQTKIMGVLNVTPDSFSDGGRFESEDLVEVARQMVLDGAEILDIGGESTGPGSVDVSLEEELRRVVPAVRAVKAALPEVLVSVDTWKSEVAEAALEAGAGMVNDITAGRGDERIFEVVARFGVPMILMYSKDSGPRTSGGKVEYEDVMNTVKKFLQERAELAKSYGVERVILDPGMGAFVSGEAKYSYEIIDRVEELSGEVLIGTSRKGFLGEDRDGGTLATTCWLKGRVDYLRVHDVLANSTVNC